MAVYLLLRTRPENPIPSGIQAAIVTTADETTQPNVVWLAGDTISLLGLTRGGDAA